MGLIGPKRYFWLIRATCYEWVTQWHLLASDSQTREGTKVYYIFIAGPNCRFLTDRNPGKCRIVNLSYSNFNSKLEIERQKLIGRKTNIFTEIMFSNSNFLNLSPS